MAYDSVLELYGGTPFDPRFEHTVLFKSETEQRAYMALRRKKRYTDFSYLRKDSTVRVGMYLEDMEDQDISYCGMYNGNKWRYYFIRRKEYLSENVTRLYLDLDVLQTYQLEWNIPACLVERAHPASDKVGEHLLDEGLELGEFVSSFHHTFIDLSDPSKWAVIVQSSVDLTDTAQAFGAAIQGSAMGSAYSGLAHYAFIYNTAGISRLTEVIYRLNEIGRTDAILNMWMYPTSMLNVTLSAEAPVKLVSASQKQTVVRVAQPTLDGYVPRNNKLHCYPYSYMYAHNNSGESAIFKYEYFGDQISFGYMGAISPDTPVKLFPKQYRGINEDYESGILLQGYPTCAWTQDFYKIWMAQNQNTQSFTMQSANIEAGVGLAMAGAGVVQAGVTLGGETDMLTSGAKHLYSAYERAGALVAQRKDAQVQPPQSKGAHSTSVNASLGAMTFSICDMSVDANHAAMIDEYFDMYGYKINRVQVPPINTRPNWNFIKTVGCVVLGDFDASDRRLIGEIFDKGVTFWHSPDIVYQYAQYRDGNVAEKGAG